MTLNIKSYFKHGCRTHERYRLSPNVPCIAYVNIKLEKDLKEERERERERERESTKSLNGNHQVENKNQI